MSGGTDNHLMLVDLRTFDADLTGKEAQDVARPRRHHASTRTPIPDDPRSPFVTSGLRIGTPAVTTQGMGEPEMARDRRRSSHRALADRDDEAELAAVRDEVGDALLEVHAVPGAEWPGSLARAT